MLAHVHSLLASQDCVRIFDSPLWTSHFLDLLHFQRSSCLSNAITAVGNCDVKQLQVVVFNRYPEGLGFSCKVNFMIGYIATTCCPCGSMLQDQGFGGGTKPGLNPVEGLGLLLFIAVMVARLLVFKIVMEIRREGWEQVWLKCWKSCCYQTSLAFLE